MHKKRLLIFWVIGLVLFSGVALAKNEGFFDWLDRYFEKKYYSTENQIRHVRIAGIDLWIPKNYKFGGYNTPDLDQISVGLQVLLPDFEPRTPENIEKFTKGNGWATRGTILLHDFSQSTDINYRYKSSLDLTKPHEPIESLHGFDETFKSSYPDDPKVINGSEFYVMKSGNNIQAYIMCGIGKQIIDQGCKHHFIYHNKILIKISYSSRYLPEWKMLEQKMTALLDQFRIQPPQGEAL